MPASPRRGEVPSPAVKCPINYGFYYSFQFSVKRFLLNRSAQPVSVAEGGYTHKQCIYQNDRTEPQGIIKKLKNGTTAQNGAPQFRRFT